MTEGGTAADGVWLGGVGRTAGEEAVSLSFETEEIYRQQPPGDWIGN